jgi:hypothetical protein
MRKHLKETHERPEYVTGLTIPKQSLKSLEELPERKYKYVSILRSRGEHAQVASSGSQEDTVE